MRREFKKQVMLQALLRAGGKCESDACRARGDKQLKLATGDIFYDHRIPDQLGGEPTLENCQILCKLCHKAKTTKEDVPRIAKAKRQQLRHLGIKPPSRWPKRRFG